MSRFRRTVINIILGVVGLALIFLAGLFVAVNVSPKPFAWFVQRQFAAGIGVKPDHARRLKTRLGNPSRAPHSETTTD